MNALRREDGLAFHALTCPNPTPFSSGTATSLTLAQAPRLVPLHPQAPPRPPCPAPSLRRPRPVLDQTHHVWLKLKLESGRWRRCGVRVKFSVPRSTPGGRGGLQASRRLKESAQNRLACRGWASGTRAARDWLSARHRGAGSESPGTGPRRSASARPQFPGVCGSEHVATQPCAGVEGGTRAGSRMHQWNRGGGVAAISRQSLCGIPLQPVSSEGFSAAVMVRPLNCIVSVSQNMGIGKNGELPWPWIRCLPGGGWVGVRGRRLAQAALD